MKRLIVCLVILALAGCSEPWREKCPKCGYGITYTSYRKDEPLLWKKCADCKYTWETEPLQ